jgi:hypothetical protein
VGRYVDQAASSERRPVLCEGALHGPVPALEGYRGLASVPSQMRATGAVPADHVRLLGDDLSDYSIRCIRQRMVYRFGKGL